MRHPEGHRSNDAVRYHPVQPIPRVPSAQDGHDVHGSDEETDVSAWTVTLGYPAAPSRVPR